MTHLAIKGLRQGLPVLGYAKIGMPGEKQGTKMPPPVKFDHIELTTTERQPNGRLVPDIDLLEKLLREGAPTCGGCDRSKHILEVTQNDIFAYGLPTAIQIGLPYNDLELAFPNRLAYYRGRTLFCSGDMETAMRARVLRQEVVNGKKIDVLGSAAPWVLEPGTHEFDYPHGATREEVDAAEKRVCGPGCPDFDLDPPRCKPAARLRFVLKSHQVVGGCYEFRTTSWNSIANIQASLNQMALVTGGHLAWLELKFEIVQQTVQPRSGAPANQQMIARVIPVGTHQELLESVKQQLELRAPVMAGIRQLEASISRAWTLTPDEVEEFREEFDPQGLERERLDDVREPVVEATDTAATAGEPEGGAQTATASADSSPSDTEAAPSPADSSSADTAPPALTPPASEEPPPKEIRPELVSEAAQQMRKDFARACRNRAEQAKRPHKAAELVQKVLKQQGFEASHEVPEAKWPELILAAQNAVVPS